MGKGQSIRRAPGVLSQSVGAEYVVVNPDTHQAHALNGPLAGAWAATEHGQPADPDAVAQLVDAGLLVETEGLTRRAVLARGGLVAAGVGIVSVGLPMVNASASGQTITRTPTSGPVGTVVSVSGTLFPASSGVVITFDGVTMTTTPASPVTNGVGTFTNVQFTVPSATVGVHTIAAIAGGQSASITFTVTAGVVITPNPFPKGGSPISATIGGSGFTPGDTVTKAQVSGDTLTFNTNTFTVDANGAFLVTRTLTYGSGNRSGVVSFTDQHAHTFNVSWSA